MEFLYAIPLGTIQVFFRSLHSSITNEYPAVYFCKGCSSMAFASVLSSF